MDDYQGQNWDGHILKNHREIQEFFTSGLQNLHDGQEWRGGTHAINGLEGSSICAKIGGYVTK